MGNSFRTYKCWIEWIPPNDIKICENEFTEYFSKINATRFAYLQLK